VLFDCAGLVREPTNVLDELAQRAAIEALQSCSAVLFCVDSAKADLTEDMTIRSLVQNGNMVYIATKSDLLSGDDLLRRTHELTTAFSAEFTTTSVGTGAGLQDLLSRIEGIICRDGVPCLRSRKHAEGNESTPSAQARIVDGNESVVALTARHRQAVMEAMESVRQAALEVNRGNEEVAVMMIRAACQAISQIEQQPIDEQVLDRIFSRFCVGK
jgi:tRNA U34 5-carboxymethylaminomethyl modifying GTPase MnmE/TrmE